MVCFEGDDIPMISRFILYFILLSFVGYLYECIAMVIWTGKWDNRGFLFGPVIPIYGAGALFGTILFQYFVKDLSMLQVFLISMVASAILEYTVHYTLEKLFHAYWWDYSKSPLNLNGRICLPASLGFGLAGLLIIYVLNPVLIPILDGLNDTLADVLALICTVVFTADLTVTVTTLSSFSERVEAMDSFINTHMDSLVGSITDESKGIGPHFYRAVDRVEETRKRLMNDRMDRAVGSMSFLRSLSLSKIKGFTGRNAARMNYALGRIKERIRKIGK